MTGEIAYEHNAHADWEAFNALLDQKSLPSGKGTEMGQFCNTSDQKEQSGQKNFQMFLSDTNIGDETNANLEDGMTMTGTENYFSHRRKPLINGLETEDGLKKVDSFSRWIAKELGEAGELDMQSSNGISWSIMGSEFDPTMSAQMQGDDHTLNPSISQDQLFSIIDFSPSWAYTTLETKVIRSDL